MLTVASYLCLRVHARNRPLNAVRDSGTSFWKYGRQLEIAKRQKPRRRARPGRQQQRHSRGFRIGHGDRLGNGERHRSGPGHRRRIAIGVGEDMREHGTVGVQDRQTEREVRAQSRRESEPVATPPARETTAGMNSTCRGSTTAELPRLQGLTYGHTNTMSD